MKKTIAQKKALELSRSHTQKHTQKEQPYKAAGKKGRFSSALLACVPFAAIAYFCKYVLPGYSFTAFVCVCIIGVILFYAIMPAVGKIFPGFARTATIVFTAALVCGLALFCVTEYFIIRASFGTAEPQSEYLIVLGAKVRENGPSVSLQDRISAAAAFLQEHPNVIAIVSGGQGKDEPMAEADCMYQNLIALGIPESRIWVEDQSTSTDENLRFSLNLIEEKTGTRPQKIAILSSEYHLLRASLMLKKLGVEFEGVPAKTSRVSQLINHCMREVAGVWHFYIFGR